jgi:hypothetical protein
MPRKAPNLEGGVIEHRMTLGDLERSQIIPMLEDSRQLLKSKRTAVQINNVKEGVIAGSILIGSLGVGIAGYAAYEWVTGSGVISSISSWLDTQRQRLRVSKGEPAGFTNSKGEELDSLGIFFPFNQWVSWIP